MGHKVAVLLTTYNGLSYVGVQIATILQQRNVDLDLYIYDDCSSDGTIKYLQALEHNHENIYVCYGEKNNGSAALSFIKLIMSVPLSYDYFALSDQDDIWLENKLIYAITEMGGEYEFFSSDVVAFWEDGKTKIIKNSQPQKKFDYLFGSAGPGCTFVISHQGYTDMVKFMRLNYDKVIALRSHDWFVYFYARTFSRKWYISDIPHMFYRQHSQNFTGANKGLEAYLSRVNKMLSGEYRSKIIQMLELMMQGSENSCKYYNSIKTFGIMDRFRLALSSYMFRRSKIDVVSLAIFILFVIK